MEVTWGDFLNLMPGAILRDSNLTALRCTEAFKSSLVHSNRLPRSRTTARAKIKNLCIRQDLIYVGDTVLGSSFIFNFNFFLPIHNIILFIFWSKIAFTCILMFRCLLYVNKNVLCMNQKMIL